MIPILLWNSKGYKEWISLDEFIKDYSHDFEQIKDWLAQINKTDPDKKKFDSDTVISFKDLLKEENTNVY